MAIEGSTQALLLNSMSRMRAEVAPAAERDGSASVSFGQLLKSGLEAIDQQQHEAARLQTEVATGVSDDLVGAMVMSQKAGLSFSALVQIRNRLVSGFDEIMRMPL